MTLENWDYRKQKYILYRSSEQHREDCAQFPFDQIPCRVFLDTNVINLLVKHSAHVFGHEPLVADTEETLAEDIEALTHVFHVGARANWDLCGSQKTIDELSRTKSASLRSDMLDYALGLMNQVVDDEDQKFAADFGRRLVGTHFVSALPDTADQELIGNAIGLGCDSFCTCDRATIVRKRQQMKGIPLRIFTPSEWWAHIKPWAGLWA